MIPRSLTPVVFMLLASCGARSGGSPALHDPALSLVEAAAQDTKDTSIYQSYSNSGPVRWNQGWPWKFDLTGISSDVRQTATAITPRHVVMARHYQRKIGQRIVFHDRRGSIHVRSLIKVVGLEPESGPADVAIGLLDRPLPRSIRTYPLPAPRADYDQLLAGACVLVTEQKRRLFVHQVRGISHRAIRLRYDNRLPVHRKKPLVVGDSGNPSFILSNGELLLVETHTTGGPGAGPFYGSPDVVKAIRQTVQELDPTFSIRTIAIDARTLEEAAEGRTHFDTTSAFIRKAGPRPSHANKPAKPKPKPGSNPKPRPRVIVPTE